VPLRVPGPAAPAHRAIPEDILSPVLEVTRRGPRIWGNSEGAPDWRSDPQNLPPGLTKETWPKTTYALMSSGDYGSAYRERAEIYDLVRDEKITGFAIVSGDRHSFWAGYATSELPPDKFDPVGLSFVGASLSSAGTMEAYEHSFPKADPLRPLFLADRPGGDKPDWAYNMLLKHGVRSCLEYTKSFDLKRAHAVSNAELAPHLEFVDLWRPRLCDGSAQRG
jgi:alkaline phosphatase D